MIESFKDQEKEYEDWCNANIDGFVFNYAKGKTGNVLHNVGCYYLNTPSRKGRYTFHKKICSNDLKRLTEIAYEVSESDGWRSCRSCFKGQSIS